MHNVYAVTGCQLSIHLLVMVWYCAYKNSKFFHHLIADLHQTTAYMFNLNGSHGHQSFFAKFRVSMALTNHSVSIAISWLTKLGHVRIDRRKKIQSTFVAHDKQMSANCVVLSWSCSISFRSTLFQFSVSLLA